jgi:hypothetical protein
VKTGNGKRKPTAQTRRQVRAAQIPFSFDDLTSGSIAEVRKRVAAAKWSKDGVTCPCCDQLCKVYRRRVTPTMIGFMIQLRKLHRQNVEWAKVGYDGQIRCEGGDYARLLFWGLVEQQNAGPREDGSRRTGYWRLNAHGEAFLRGDLAVPEYIYQYNEQRLPDPEGVNIRKLLVHELLRKNFNLEEAMST